MRGHGLVLVEDHNTARSCGPDPERPADESVGGRLEGALGDHVTVGMWSSARLHTANTRGAAEPGEHPLVGLAKVADGTAPRKLRFT